MHMCIGMQEGEREREREEMCVCVSLCVCLGKGSDYWVGSRTPAPFYQPVS